MAGTGNLLLKRGTTIPTDGALARGMPAVQLLATSPVNLTSLDKAFVNYPNRLWIGMDASQSLNGDNESGNFDAGNVESGTGTAGASTVIGLNNLSVSNTRPLWMGAEIRAFTPVDATTTPAGAYTILKADWLSPSDYVLVTQKAIYEWGTTTFAPIGTSTGSLTVLDSNGSSTVLYPILVDGTGTAKAIYADVDENNTPPTANSFHYNSSTNTLTAANFAGNATSATSAGSINGVDGIATNSNFKVPFTNLTGGTSATQNGVGIDVDSENTFHYNPSTNTLTAANFAGNATTATTAGTATTATTAGTATNLAGGGTGSIPYQTASSTTAFVSDPNIAGAIFTYNDTTNAPAWTNPTSITVGTATNVTVATDNNNTAFRIPFFPTAVTTGGLLVDSTATDFTYNPSSGQMSVGSLRLINNILSSGGTTVMTVSGADAVFSGDLAVNGGDITTSASDMNLFSGKTSGNITIGGAGSTTVIGGDLTVNGTTTTINTTNLNVEDTVVTLNFGFVGASPTQNAGIEIERGDPANVSLIWDETADKWSANRNGTNTYPIVIADSNSTLHGTGTEGFGNSNDGRSGDQYIHTAYIKYLDVKNLVMSGSWTLNATITSNLDLKNGGLLLPYIEGTYHSTSGNQMSNLPEGQIAYDITDNRIVFNQGSQTNATAETSGTTLQTIISTGNLTDITQVGTLTNTAFSVADATTVALGTSTNAPTINIGTGAIASGAKTINIGTASTTGSTTAITIGGTGGTTNTTALNSISTTVGGTLGVTGLTTLSGGLTVDSGGILTVTGLQTITTFSGLPAGQRFRLANGTYTFSSAVAAGTYADWVASSMGQPTITSQTNAITLTDASTLYVATPTASANTTITNAYSIKTTGSIKVGGSLVFEGATSNAVTTTLAVTDPTSTSKTITLPDWSGTVVVPSGSSTAGFLMRGTGNSAQPAWTDNDQVTVGGVYFRNETTTTTTRFPIPFLASSRDQDDPGTFGVLSDNAKTEGFLKTDWSTSQPSGSASVTNASTGLMYEVGNGVGTLYADYIGATLDCGTYT